jgi:hypothetical protein
MLAKELGQLRDGRSNELWFVVEIDMCRTVDHEQLLRLLGLPVDPIAPELRLGLGTCDNQQGPR